MAGLLFASKENMMINFSLNAKIYRSLTQVFSFVTTPENDFQWQYGTLASTQLSKGEMGIGTLFRTIGHFMGRRVESTYEVTQFEPNKKFGFKSLSGPMHSHTLYTFEVINGSTRMNIATQASPGDLFKTADVIVEKRVKKQYRENLAILKDVLEASRADHI
jgi:Polyketide cyclase / dehydrase and lipid transport